MNFENLSIVSVRHVDAPHRVTSAEIMAELSETTQRLGLPPNLLESLAGIHERRFWNEQTEPSDAATLAAEVVLEDADLDRSRLGVLINTSVCRDYIEPSTACLVHGNLGLPAACDNFDVGSACIAFANGMEIVGNMIELGQIEYGIVVDGEGSRYVVESTIERLQNESTDEQTFRDHFAALTLGSGAVAMVLAHRDRAPRGARRGPLGSLCAAGLGGAGGTSHRGAPRDRLPGHRLGHARRGAALGAVLRRAGR